jgi:hypothetical protein
MIPFPLTGNQNNIQHLIQTEPIHWIVLNEDLLANLYPPSPSEETLTLKPMPDRIHHVHPRSDEEIDLHKKLLVLQEQLLRLVHRLMFTDRQRA